MLNRILVLLLASALLVACSAAPSKVVRIDARSQETAEASYRAMMDRLSPDQQFKLALAVLVLNMEGVNSVYDVLASPDLKSPSVGHIRAKVAGMNAEEIVALSTQVSDVRIEPARR